MNNIELAAKILSHYRERVNPEMTHYYGIIASMGLVGMTEVDSEYLPLLREVLEAFPDKVKHPRYNFPSYRVGGIAKARAVYDGFIEGRDGELREYAEELMTAKRSADGVISMPWDGGEKKIWIDVATAATPFLLFAGLRLDERRYIDEAVFQTLTMYDIFRDETNQLLHQARGFCDGDETFMKISDDHWSRGNGWGIYPLSMLCEFLPADHPEKPRCEAYFKAHAEALRSFISPRGLWRQEITSDRPESYDETSGSGLILAALATGIRLGLLNDSWKPIVENGLSALVAYSVGEDGNTSHSCPGCLCPGDGSVEAYLTHRTSFKDEPHGAGPVILALVEAAKLK